MDPEETKICSNCKKEVSSSNYLTHTAHCPRNITLCKKCGEPYPIKEIEKHNVEMHSTVKCTKCKKDMQKLELEDHQKNVCTKRMVKCEFCSIENSFDELKLHEDYCGSRTERCDECGEYIMLKFRAKHLASNHTVLSPDSSSEKPKNSSAGIDFDLLNPRANAAVNSFKNPPVSTYPQNPSKRTNDRPQVNTSLETTVKSVHKPLIPVRRNSNQLSFRPEDSYLSSEDLDHLLAVHMAEEEFIRDVPDIDPFPNDLDVVPPPPAPLSLLEKLRNDQVGQYNRPERNTFRISPPYNSTNATFNTHFDDSPEESVPVVPCEFCDELFPVDVIEAHQSYCEDFRDDLPTTTVAATTTVNASSKPSTPVQPNTPKSFSSLMKSSSIESDPGKENGVLIPCEYCDDLFSIDSIILHQSGCEKSGISSTGPPYEIEEEERPYSHRTRHQPDPDINDPLLREAIQMSLNNIDQPHRNSRPNERPSGADASKVRIVPIRVDERHPSVQQKKNVASGQNHVRDASSHYKSNVVPLVKAISNNQNVDSDEDYYKAAAAAERFNSKSNPKSNSASRYKQGSNEMRRTQQNRTPGQSHRDASSENAETVPKEPRPPPRRYK